MGLPALLFTAGLEAAVGEPPTSVHPVVWAGRYLQRAGDRLPSSPPARAVVSGGAAWTAGAAAAATCGLLTSRATRRLPAALRPVATGAALWPLMSARLLLREVEGVERALSVGADEGRAALARIVSRDTGSLEATEVRAAAVESLAENASDSVVAPLFWYVVAGLPGAFVYRFANTADAMWGYRSPRWQHAGRVAARADDLLNVVPARLTAALMLVGARRGTWGRLPAQASTTPSPNAGWPMGAVALRLGVRLGKRDAYVLNPSGREPDAADTAAALALTRRVMVVAGVLAAVAEHLTRRRAGSGAR